MTDEEFGRAWANQMNMVPWARPAADDPTVTMFAWLWSEFPGLLPRHLYSLIRPNVATSEDDIYAQLGRAVQDYRAAVPPLRRGPMTMYVQCTDCGGVVKTDLPPGGVT